jgi:hypothetical protein
MTALGDAVTPGPRVPELEDGEEVCGGMDEAITWRLSP